ncbi:MAG: hypothetical protein O3C27_10740 [Actinomycetota bacterium]|nr:hypothetical protein [Actinomycetota bacterium]
MESETAKKNLGVRITLRRELIIDLRPKEIAVRGREATEEFLANPVSFVMGSGGLTYTAKRLSTGQNEVIDRRSSVNEGQEALLSKAR